ncbi:MAG: radical SAM protein [Kiritimatiellae bacterium]|nr:radical SAM protein [Kiritimatiellia bacterium]
MFPHLKTPKAEIEARIAAATESDAVASATKERPGFFDLLNLISPAASGCMPLLRSRAAQERRRYYGRTVSVYAPLYIGNTCVNSCRYCDFRVQHQGTARKDLTMDEILMEAAAVRASGIDSLLVVAGENPRVNSVEHLAEVGRELKKRFSYLALEVAPQTEEGYRTLFKAGFEGLTCFQETYDEERYGYFHPAGPKSNYRFRLETQSRAGRAGFRTLGIAFLLGLVPWRLEAASLAAHALWLQKECWRSRIQFAFPRFCPTEGGFQPEHPVCDGDLEQMMLAFRIVFPRCCMTVSTREAPAFRDAIVQTAADNMSAGSRVTPGGYAVAADGDVAQFTLTDKRPPEEVFAAIRANGQEVVFKNWDNRIGG